MGTLCLTHSLEKEYTYIRRRSATTMQWSSSIRDKLEMHGPFVHWGEVVLFSKAHLLSLWEVDHFPIHFRGSTIAWSLHCIIDTECACANLISVYVPLTFLSCLAMRLLYEVVVSQDEVIHKSSGESSCSRCGGYQVFK